VTASVVVVSPLLFFATMSMEFAPSTNGIDERKRPSVTVAGAPATMIVASGGSTRPSIDSVLVFTIAALGGDSTMARGAAVAPVVTGETALLPPGGLVAVMVAAPAPVAAPEPASLPLLPPPQDAAAQAITRIAAGRGQEYLRGIVLPLIVIV
jgi:hypothetical protein